LEIFQTSGARIDRYKATIGSYGTESLPLEWNPSSRLINMKPGVYIYRMLVTTAGKTASGSGRLVYMYR
jgi:hypothetical protein